MVVAILGLMRLESYQTCIRVRCVNVGSMGDVWCLASPGSQTSPTSISATPEEPQRDGPSSICSFSTHMSTCRMM